MINMKSLCVLAVTPKSHIFSRVKSKTLAMISSHVLYWRIHPGSPRISLAIWLFSNKSFSLLTFPNALNSRLGGSIYFKMIHDISHCVHPWPIATTTPPSAMAIFLIAKYIHVAFYMSSTSLSSQTKYIMDEFLFTLNISVNINMMP